MVAAKGYRVRKNWRGKRVVEYGCPHCGTNLRSSLTEAGKQDYCPGCSNDFVVPGSGELRQLQEAEYEAQQHKQRKKELAKEHARQAFLERERQRAHTAKLVAEEKVELEQRAAEARSQELKAKSTTATAPTGVGNGGTILSFGGGAVCIAVIVVFYLSFRNSDLRSKINQCESFKIVNASVSYEGFVGSDIVVFDLRDGSKSGARRIDPVHLLMQFADKIDLYEVDRVILARNGQQRFYLQSKDLRPLVNSYAGGGRIWAFKNLPASIYRMSGSRPFGEWTGGWLGVLQKQSEDLNDFLTAWQSTSP